MCDDEQAWLDEQAMRREYEQPMPQPCEGCYYITGKMMICDDTCKGLTAENLEERRREWDEKNTTKETINGIE